MADSSANNSADGSADSSADSSANNSANNSADSNPLSILPPTSDFEVPAGPTDQPTSLPIEPIQAKITELLGDDMTRRLIQALIDHQAVLAGGLVLGCYTEEAGDWQSDFDIYVNVDQANALMKKLLEIFGRSSVGRHNVPQYDQSFMRKNQIVKRYYFKHYNLQVDVMVIKNQVSPVTVVNNFDLSFCEIWFDGLTVQTHYWSHIRNKSGILKPDYLQAYLVHNNRFIAKRMAKYQQRGFKIALNVSQLDYIVPNLPRVKQVTSPEAWAVGFLWHYLETSEMVAPRYDYYLQDYTFEEFYRLVERAIANNEFRIDTTEPFSYLINRAISGLIHQFEYSRHVANPQAELNKYLSYIKEAFQSAGTLMIESLINNNSDYRQFTEARGQSSRASVARASSHRPSLSPRSLSPSRSPQSRSPSRSPRLQSPRPSLPRITPSLRPPWAPPLQVNHTLRFLQKLADARAQVNELTDCVLIDFPSSLPVYSVLEAGYVALPDFLAESFENLIFITLSDRGLYEAWGLNYNQLTHYISADNQLDLDKVFVACPRAITGFVPRAEQIDYNHFYVRLGFDLVNSALNLIDINSIVAAYDTGQRHFVLKSRTTLPITASLAVVQGETPQQNINQQAISVVSRNHCTENTPVTIYQEVLVAREVLNSRQLNLEDLYQEITTLEDNHWCWTAPQMLINSLTDLEQHAQRYASADGSEEGDLEGESEEGESEAGDLEAENLEENQGVETLEYVNLRSDTEDNLIDDVLSITFTAGRYQVSLKRLRANNREFRLYQQSFDQLDLAQAKFEELLNQQLAQGFEIVQ